MPLRTSHSLLLVILWLAGCSQSDLAPIEYRPPNPHDAYAHALREAHLSDSALGRDWLEGSETSLEHALEVEVPFQESFYIDPARAFAIAYRFEVRRGQRAEIEVRHESKEPARLFLDLFRAANSRVSDWERVASAAETERRLLYEPRRDGEYVLRIQPELLRGGTVTVEIRKVALLTFPVDNRRPSDIGSRFGAPRDGGRRQHHGVDIFAPRHTPVLAAGTARVRRVGTNRLGGLVIWLYDDERSLNYYYAHLQSQLVARDQRVLAGEPIGTVGNSGNARTTPPHLHFAIYARGEGPIDPDFFLEQPEQTLPPQVFETAWVGRWGRTLSSSQVRRDSGPSDLLLTAGTPVRLLAGRGNFFRVALPDGTTGYLSGAVLEPADVALSTGRIPKSSSLWPRPILQGEPLAWLEPGSQLETLGFAGAFEFVRTSSGLLGWRSLSLPLSAAE